MDVEDLFIHAASGARRPTGIQRLSFELCAALRIRDPASGFLRHTADRRAFRPVAWDHVAALFAGLSEASPPQTVVGAAPSLRRRVGRRLPERVREPLGRAIGLQLAALRAVLDISRALRPSAPAAAQPPMDVQHALTFTPGDTLLVAGAAWFHAGYAAMLAAAREAGATVALIVYDLIPLRRPEWCEPGHRRAFEAWIASVLPQADRTFAISRFTAADVSRYAAERGIPMPYAPAVLPIGTGLAVPPLRTPRLPPAQSYVLFVSTIEIRKNHVLLLRVWRRLIERGAAPPLLVFAGRIGWLADDLMAQLRNSDSLDGHVRVIEDASDGELASLYDGCLFTVFPSLFEGWGLPVTESLAFARPCLTSSTTSLPEAGGGLARTFDPEDVTAATAAIGSVLVDRVELAEWQARIAREFRPVSWVQTADALCAMLDAPPRTAA